MIDMVEGDSICGIDIDGEDVVLWIEGKFADEVFAEDMAFAFEVHFLVLRDYDQVLKGKKIYGGRI